MADTATNNSEHKQRSQSPDGNTGSDHMNDDQPSGNPFPPPSFPNFYGYSPHDASPSGDGNGTWIPLQGMLHSAFGSNNGVYPVSIGSLTATGQFVPRTKRKQVKNACINCSTACKKCDNTRPCERCKKYGIGDSCVDSARKERKKGVKRGPYKRRAKAGQPNTGQDSEHPDGDWLPGDENSEAQPATVDPANLPNNHASGQNNSGYSPPEGFYSYPYPYPFPPPGEGQGNGGPDGAFPPPPHFFPHLHPAAYPPYPPWAGGFDVTGEHGGGSARTSGSKKKRNTAAHAKKNSEEVRAAAMARKGETAAARAARASRRSGGLHSPEQHETQQSPPLDDISGIDLSAVTDPSLLTDHHQANGDHGDEHVVMTIDPKASTT